MSNCLYCGQILKHDHTLHKECREHYHDKITKALQNRSYVYPELNVKRNGTFTKIKICRKCNTEVSDTHIRTTVEYIEEKNMRGVRGFCLRCVQNSVIIEEKKKRRRLQR